MKKTILSIAIILFVSCIFVSCIFVSCTKIEIEKRGVVTYKLDGVEKRFELGNSHTTTVKDGEYSILLALGDSKADLIAIFIGSYKGSFPATFNMQYSEIVTVGYTTNDLQYGAATLGDGLGAYGTFNVVIEKYENNKFSGTFEFTALKLVNKIPDENQKRVITEGKFTDIPAI